MSTESPASSAESPVLPSFDVKPYRPDGGFVPSGVIMLLCALAIAGAALGFAAHMVARYIYLIVIFPAFIGMGVGFVGMRMVKKGRVRNAWIGGLAGFLGGILAMFMMHYFAYRQHQSNIEKVITQNPGIVKLAAAPEAVRELVTKEMIKPEDREGFRWLLKEVAIQNMWQYMNVMAEEGVELKKTGTPGRGMNLGYAGSWVYWAIEVLIVAGITFAMVRKSTMEPFCSACDQWKRSKVLGWMHSHPAAAGAAIASGDLNHIRGAGASGDVVGPLRVTMAACDECIGQGDIDVKLESVIPDKQGKQQTKLLGYTVYPPDALPHLVKLFEERPPASPDASPPDVAPDAPPAPTA